MLIKEGKIVALNPKVWEKNIQILDLNNFFIIPGLIDAHTHVFLEDATYGKDFSKGLLEFYQGHTLKERKNLASRRSKALLKMGFTAIRDLGNDGGIGIFNFENDEVRLYSSGPGFTPKFGQFPSGTSEKIIFKEYARLDEFSLGLLKAGNRKVLKLYADEDPNPILAPPLLLKKWSARGHELGLKVAIHAILPKAIQAAIEAGPDSIEHGSWVTEMQLKQMAKKKITWVPSTGQRALMIANFNHNSKELTSICTMIAKAYNAGVEVVFGSDNYFSLEKYGLDFGAATLEALIYLGQCGLPSSEVLKAATFNAGRLLGDRSLGILNVGSYADFIVYKEDPLKELSVLRRPMKVFKAGKEQ
jgi:imidazolonepropionase-like amidohydrolase